MPEPVSSALNDLLPRLNTQNLTSSVEQHLRELILAGKLAPGQMISTRALAGAFGISMTPARNALDRLSQEGLVVMNPRQGARVSVPMPQDVEECFSIRLALEGLAAERTAQLLNAEILADMEQCWEAFGAKLVPIPEDGDDDIPPPLEIDRVRTLADLDRAFHNSIIKASGYIRLNQLHEMLEHSLTAGRMYFLGHGARAGHVSHQQHRMIIDAIATGDPVIARAMAEFHVRQSLTGMFAASREITRE